jgi:hypothetical protein
MRSIFAGVVMLSASTAFVDTAHTEKHRYAQALKDKARLDRRLHPSLLSRRVERRLARKSCAGSLETIADLSRVNRRP